MDKPGTKSTAAAVAQPLGLKILIIRFTCILGNRIFDTQPVPKIGHRRAVIHFNIGKVLPRIHVESMKIIFGP
jgi:hypothetical protein